MWKEASTHEAQRASICQRDKKDNAENKRLTSDELKKKVVAPPRYTSTHVGIMKP
jgi:hypothetical protein